MYVCRQVCRYTCTYACRHAGMDGDGLLGGWLAGWLAGRRDAWMAGWLAGGMHGWLAGRPAGRRDGWMGIYVARYVRSHTLYIHTYIHTRLHGFSFTCLLSLFCQHTMRIPVGSRSQPGFPICRLQERRPRLLHRDASRIRAVNSIASIACITLADVGGKTGCHL